MRPRSSVWPVWSVCRGCPGQILGGSLSQEAAKYQILIIYLIASGTGFDTFGAVSLGARRFFDKRHRLRLDRLRKYRYGSNSSNFKSNPIV